MVVMSGERDRTSEAQGLALELSTPVQYVPGVGPRRAELLGRLGITTAADLIKQAMINVFRRMKREDSEARMLLQIHDELVFEVPSSQVNALSELVIAEMSNAGQLSVPLKVDVKTGCNWADCEPLA